MTDHRGWQRGHQPIVEGRGWVVIGNTYHWANPLADHVLDLAVKDLANILHQEGCMDACERPTENTAWEKWAWELLRDRIAYHEAQGDQ